MAASVRQISLHISCFTLNWGWTYLFWLITLQVLCSWLWNFDLRFYYFKGNKKFWYICIFHLTKYHILQIIRHTGPYCAPRSQKVHVGEKIVYWHFKFELADLLNEMAVCVMKHHKLEEIIYVAHMTEFEMHFLPNSSHEFLTLQNLLCRPTLLVSFVLFYFEYTCLIHAST